MKYHQYCRRCRVHYDEHAYFCPVCQRAPPAVERRTRCMLTLIVVGIGIVFLAEIWRR